MLDTSAVILFDITGITLVTAVPDVSGQATVARRNRRDIKTKRTFCARAFAAVCRKSTRLAMFAKFGLAVGIAINAIAGLLVITQSKTCLARIAGVRSGIVTRGAIWNFATGFHRNVVTIEPERCLV